MAIASKAASPLRVVLTGNPNCGKTTLFNSLTGLRARVGNYAGVTVERKEGTILGLTSQRPVRLLDLPGTYSLSPQSPDEQIARDVLFVQLPEVPEPDLVLVVVDASNLQRNLYYATQVIELGHPTWVVLNMVDVARENGLELNVPSLSAALGIPVFPIVASTGEGLPALRTALDHETHRAGPLPEPRSFTELTESFGKEAESIESLLETELPERKRLAMAEAVLLLSDDRVLNTHAGKYPETIAFAIAAARNRLEAAGVDWRSAAIEARYARAAAIQMAVTTETSPPGETLSDRLDRVLTHRVWGLLIFVLIMGLMFQSLFTFAELPKSWLEAGVNALSSWVESSLPPGDFTSLLSSGIIQGVGSVITFLPQICFLFLFLSVLEDTGYMARAAFLMDRLMSRVGLHGKSFIPMLSSFACAIPGLMATRTIDSPKDRLVTMLIAPLMSCSARLPVYTVLIAACIPTRRLFGIFGLPGLTLLGMYLLGIAGALGMAWVFKRTLLRGEPSPMILELPPYKRPSLLVLFRHMWERSRLFLRRAGTVILAINILLWFLVSYPKISGSPAAETDRPTDQMRQSFAGRAGRFIEPVLIPLGFDWKIGIGIIASFAAREVFVSTLSVVYNVENEKAGSPSVANLANTLKAEKWPDGRPVYTPLTGITLMVFYVFALQCVSTVVVMRRESNSWKWPLFQLAYMTGLAWVLAFLTYQLGRACGWN